MTATLHHSHRRRSPKQIAIDVMLRQQALLTADRIARVLETAAQTPARHCDKPTGECAAPTCVHYHALMEAAGIAGRIGKART